MANMTSPAGLFVLLTLSLFHIATCRVAYDGVPFRLPRAFNQETNNPPTNLSVGAQTFEQQAAAGGPLTCSAGHPCIDGSCCGPKNTCGYGPDYCGTGCQSNCSATSACGRNSLNGAIKCGMNLCCSYYGWCGAGPDYCTVGQASQPGCQTAYSECQTHQPLQCDPNAASATGRTIAYYQGSNIYSADRLCNKVYPQDIKPLGYTHLYWAFAEIDSVTYEVTPHDSRDIIHYPSFTALGSSGQVKTWISIGGFDFTTANPKAWTSMVATPQNRATFINSLATFLSEYGFQGVDLDWEYPVDHNRGGSPDDMKNLVQLLADMRSNPSFSTKYGISVTLAPDIWYLQNFDAKGLLQHADWLGFMSYDLHGIWDGSLPNVGKKVYGQTDIHDIDRDLIPLWYDLTPADMKKVNFGLASYGRGYTLADPKCNKADGSCAWIKGSKPGRCTNTEGSLSVIEIQDIIKTKNLKPTALDSGNGNSMMKQITWDDQWIGYDDADTIAQKTIYASSHCFGGTMAWSIDQSISTDDDSSTNGGGSDNGDTGKSIMKTCRWSDCAINPSCKDGEVKLTEKYDDSCPFQEPSLLRGLCCPASVGVSQCTWRGTPVGECDNTAPHCPPCTNTQCLAGEFLLGNDVNGDHFGETCPFYPSDPGGGPEYSLCCKRSTDLQCPVDACAYDPVLCNIWDDGGPVQKRDLMALDESDLGYAAALHNASVQLERRGPPRFPKTPLGSNAFIIWRIASYPSRGELWSTPDRLRLILQRWLRLRDNNCAVADVVDEAVDTNNAPSTGQTEHPIDGQILIPFGRQLLTGRLPSGLPTRSPALPLGYLNGDFQRSILPAGLPNIGTSPQAISPITASDRIGESFGSYNNYNQFLLTERDINAAKGSIFGLEAPINTRTLQSRASFALNNPTPDNIASMFAMIRATVGVFSYCNNNLVTTRMQAVYNTVLTQAQLIQLYQPQARGLQEHWEEFMPDYFTQIEDFAQEWVRSSLREIELIWGVSTLPQANDVLAAIGDLRDKISGMKLPRF